MTWKPVIIAVSIAACVLAALLMHWRAIEDAKAGRDAWWRGEIARATGAIDAEAAKRGEQILLSDAALIAKMGEQSARRKQAEEQLEAIQKRGTGDSRCPRIPAECLR